MLLLFISGNVFRLSYSCPYTAVWDSCTEKLFHENVPCCNCCFCYYWGDTQRYILRCILRWTRTLHSYPIHILFLFLSSIFHGVSVYCGIPRSSVTPVNICLCSTNTAASEKMPHEHGDKTILYAYRGLHCRKYLFMCSTEMEGAGNLWVRVRIRVSHITTDGQSDPLGFEPLQGLMTRFLFL
jgi:hypothetical protein